jgi:hypothetical protein
MSEAGANAATRSVITNSSAVPNRTTIAVRKLHLAGQRLDPVARKLDHAGPKPDLDPVDRKRDLDAMGRKRDLDAMDRKVDRVGRRIAQSRRPRLAIAMWTGSEIVHRMLSPPPAAKGPRTSVRGLFFCADQARGAA